MEPRRPLARFNVINGRTETSARGEKLCASFPLND